MTNVSKNITTTQIRSSNFELLRILSMFAIILGHFFVQSNAAKLLSDYNLLIIAYFSLGFRIAVNIFLIMGIWFMLDKKFKASRILNLYGQLIFYTVPIFVILKLFHININPFTAFTAFFPFITWALWFVSAYIILTMLSPFLNKILEFNRIVIKKFLIVLTLFIPILSTISMNMDTKLCVLLYFIYAYLYVGYFKKYLYNKIHFNKYWGLIIAFIIYTLLIFAKYIIPITNNGFLCKIITNIICDYKCIPNLLISLPIFYFFLNTDIGSNKIINFTAKSALSVYIIHQAPGIPDFLWHNVYNCDFWFLSKHPIIYVLFVAVSLYFVCSIVDYFRRKFIEPIYMNSRLYKFLEYNIDKFYKDVLNEDLKITGAKYE